MEVVTGILRSVTFAAEASAVGFCAGGRWAVGRLGQDVGARLDILAKRAALLALFALLATILPRAATMAGKPLLDLDTNDYMVVIGQTWVGHVWCLQVGLMIAAFLLITVGYRMGGGIAATALAFGTLSSHTIASGGGFATALANAAHVVAATLWFGGLLPLAVVRFTGRGIDFRKALTGFSAIALPLMIVVIGTGTVLTVARVGSWAGLFGTEYGAILLFKMAGLAIVLMTAANLRIYRGSHALPHARRSWSGYLLALEYVAATIVVFAAGVLGQTTPAIHGDVVWHLDFRFAPQTAWKDPGNERSIYAGIAVFLVALGFAFVMRARGARRVASVVAVSGCMIGSAMALPAMTVPAFPSTFDRSPISYGATNIAWGQTTFHTTCWSCHGRSGRGDGPAATTMRPPPADLTAPHLGDHTMGDMFWWVSNGYAGSAMPGFKATLSDDERWRLVNYVMALSLGYQGRLIGPDIAPAFPWLPAIDFAIPGQEPEHTLLAPRGRSNKLLVFLGGSAPAALRETLSHLADLETLDVVIVVGPHAVRADVDLAQDGPRLTVVDDRDGVISSAWALYRRSLVHPGFDDTDGLPRVVAFLVDRFGYVRARWRNDEDCPLFDVASLTKQVRDLSNEPDINGPDAHVH